MGWQDAPLADASAATATAGRWQDAPIERSTPEKINRMAGVAARNVGPVAGGALLGAGIGSVVPGVGTVIGGAAGATAGGLVQLMDNVLGTQAVDTIMDKLGLPRAETRGERLVQDVTGAIGGQAGVMAGGRLMAEAGGPVARRVGEVLSAGPVAQTIGAAGSGLAAGEARERGAGTLGQAGAGLAGGLVAPLAAQTVASGAKALGRGAVAAVKPFTQGGREEVVGTTLRRLSTSPDSVISRLEAPAEIIPGSAPTTAQAARDPGLLTAERALRSGPSGGRFVERASQQNTARNALLNSIAGDDAALAAAKADRSRVASQLYGDALGAAEMRPPQMKDTSLSISQFVAKEGGLRKDLVGRDLNPDYSDLPPGLLAKGLGVRRVIHGGQSAHSPDEMLLRLQEAGYLGKKSDINDMYNLLDDELSSGTKKVMSSFDVDDFAAAKSANEIRPPDAVMELSTRPAFQQAVKRAQEIASEEGLSIGDDPTRSIKGLHYVKLAMDDIIEKAQARESTIGRTQLRAILSTKEKLLQMMDEMSPTYQAAREEFAIQSKPINQMESLQEVRGRVLNAGTDAATGERIMSPAKFYQAVTKNEGELKKILTPEQMGTLRNIGRDLDQGALSDSAGKAAGSNTYQNVSTAYILGRSLGGAAPDSPLLQNLMRPLAWLNKLNEPALQELITDAMLDPAIARSLMQKASPRAVESVALELQQRARALTLGASQGTASTVQPPASERKQPERREWAIPQ
jgi:hypothetical protein